MSGTLTIAGTGLPSRWSPARVMVSKMERKWARRTEREKTATQTAGKKKNVREGPSRFDGH